MNNNIFKAITTITTLLLTAVSSRSGYAEMMEDLTLLSPKAMAMANAVTADPPRVDSIHFNPAGLIRLRQSTIELKLAAFYLESSYRTGAQQVDPTARTIYENLTQEPYPQDPYANQSGATESPMLLAPGGSTESSRLPIVPLGGGAVRSEDSDVVFATAAYSPMMVGFTRPADDVGRYQGVETAISRITYFSPTLALQMTDTVALGFGINFSYQGLALKMETRSPQAVSAVLGAFAENVTGDQLGPKPYDDLATLSITAEDYLSVGFNIGLLWTPEPWWTLGLAYRSAAKSNLEGDFSFHYSPEMMGLSNALKPVLSKMEGNEYEEGDVTMELKTPQHLSIGTSFQVTSNFKLNLDLQRSYYKDWDKFTFNFDQPIDYLVFATFFDKDVTDTSLSLQRRYKNSTSWSVAGEYDWNSRLKLRAGYQRRNSAIPNNALDLTIPISDADYYGVGFEFSGRDDTTYEVGVGYLISEYHIDYGQSSNANGEDPLDLVYNPYVFLPIDATTRALLLAFSFTKPL